MPLHRLTMVVLAGLASLAASSCLHNTPDPFHPDQVMATVTHLSSDELDGRLAGSDGYSRAADWASARFAELGLEPGWHGEYLQPVSVEVNQIESLPTLAIVPDHGGDREPLEAGRDFLARGFSGNGHVLAPVVFCGYGLSMPERGWDDYAGINVKDKVALVFKGPPKWSLDEEGWGEAPLPRPKTLTAAEHGALAVLFVTDPAAGPWAAPFASVVHGPGEQPEQVPQLHVSVEVADRLLAAADSNLADLKQEMDSDHAPRSLLLPVAVDLEVNARYESVADAPNVIAILPGSDPELRDQHLVIGAHLDHVGRQGDVLFPGANDNASGVAGVLAIAEAFSRAPEPPRRTVVFALFSAEEQGLMGAEAYVAHPALPLTDCVAMFNLDCIGEGEAIKIGSGEANPKLWKLAKTMDESNARRVVDDTWYGGGADAQPFFDAGIATLYFVLEDGYHYVHGPGDTPDTLDPSLLADTAQLAYDVAVIVARGEYQPEDRQPAPAS